MTSVFMILTLVLYSISIAFSSSDLLRAADHNPIQLFLQRKDPFNNTIIGRTRASLFEDSLGIHRNQLVDFDEESWSMIKKSGLFRELTANVSLGQEDGRVRINIYGTEAPSRIFSPQLSLESIDGFPLVSGTISFIDRNFRGLGQRLKIALSLSDNALNPGASSMTAMHPTGSIEWNDWRVAPKGNTDFDVSLRASSRTTLLNPAQFGLNTLDTEQNKLESGDSLITSDNTEATTTIRKLSGKLSRYFPKLFLAASVKPFLTSVHFQNCSSIGITGAETSLRMQSKTAKEPTLKAWHLGGITSSLGFLSGQFHQIGAKVMLKTKFGLPSSTTAQVSTSNSSTASDQRRIIPSNFKKKFLKSGLLRSNLLRRMYLDFKITAGATRVWGPGCIPQFHCIDLNSQELLRGFLRPTLVAQPSSLAEYNGENFVACGNVSYIAPSYSKTGNYAFAKLDLSISGPFRVIPGMFLDVIGYHSYRDNSKKDVNLNSSLLPSLVAIKKAMSIGASLRFKQFRAEAAWQLNERQSWLPYCWYPKLLLGMEMSD